MALLTVEVRDEEGNKVQGAVVVVIPEQPFFDNVSHSEQGGDWPDLPFARCNKTGLDGTCQIYVPDGAGDVCIFSIPPSEDIEADVVVHVNIP